MLGLAGIVLLPALRYTALVLGSTAAINLLQAFLVPGGFDPVASTTVLSRVPGALWEWAFPIARVAFIAGLCAAFLVLGLAAARVSDRWRPVLGGVLAGGATGYFLFWSGPVVDLLPPLEYLAAAVYAAAGAEIIER